MLPTSEGWCETRDKWKRKRIRNSLNICGATPLVSQNHVLTTLRAGSSTTLSIVPPIYIHPSRRPPPSAHRSQPEGWIDSHQTRTALCSTTYFANHLPLPCRHRRHILHHAQAPKSLPTSSADPSHSALHTHCCGITASIQSLVDLLRHIV